MKYPTTLAETVDLMNSNNYKERFIAEYYQLKIRMISLLNMGTKWDNGSLEFIPSCPRELYVEQLQHMIDYALTLRDRARIEGIPLEEEDENDE